MIFKKSKVFLNNLKYAQKHLIHEKYQNQSKNNFNSEYGRGKYLEFIGESPIFFGSILNLIWIIENKENKNESKNIIKNVDHLISLINWGGRSSGMKHAFHQTHESVRCTRVITKSAQD